jgi:PAS domain S-box-containing protein
MEAFTDCIPETFGALDILESVSDAVALFDREWRVLYSNAPAAALARMPREQAQGKVFWDLFPEVAGTNAEVLLRRTLEDGVRRRFEHYYRPFDLWIEVDSLPTPRGIAVFVRDINHRKKADFDKEALCAALQNSPVVLFNQDANLRYTWVYNPLEDFQDIDWNGKTDADWGDGMSPFVDLKQGVLRTGLSARREIALTWNGEKRHFDLYVKPVFDENGKVSGLTGSATEITARVRSQEQIERQQAQLRAVIDGMPGLVSYVDRNYHYRFVNAEYSKWLGRKIEDVEGRTVCDLVGDEAFREIVPHLDRALRGEPVSFERYLKCIDGVRYVRATYAPQAGVGGNIEGVIVLVYDITEQKRAEEARFASELRFRRIVELAGEGIWMLDTEARTTFANGRMAELLGYEPDELLGRSCFDFIHPEELERGRAGFVTRMQGDRQPREYRFVRRDGAIVWLDFTATPIGDGFSNENSVVTGLLAMCTDITERKLAQDQLRQTQKLESLGVLAGGIAHDFNNLLVGILGNAGLAADTVGSTSPAGQMLAGVVSAAERAAKLTRQLLAYAGRDNRRTSAVNLDALVADILPLLHASVPRTVDLRLRLDGNLPLIEGDEGQLQQIVMNLVINGAEAIPEGRPGSVSVATEVREPTPAERQRAVIPLPGHSARYVLLTVADTGIGMDADTAAHIFDPFFTTKFTGRGLGLSAVLGIIKAHAGTLILESAPSQGTTFRVFLRASASTPVAAPPVASAPAPARRTGTILVVDDEQAVRSVATLALELSGYEVLAVTDGVEAIDAVTAHPEIDAVLLDLAMPGMTGDRAAPEIRRVRPGIRIVLSSGYAEHEARRRFTDVSLDGFLQKPYTGRALVGALREALSKA